MAFRLPVPHHRQPKHIYIGYFVNCSFEFISEPANANIIALDPHLCPHVWTFLTSKLTNKPISANTIRSYENGAQCVGCQRRLSTCTVFVCLLDHNFFFLFRLAIWLGLMLLSLVCVSVCCHKSNCLPMIRCEVFFLLWFASVYPALTNGFSILWLWIYWTALWVWPKNLNITVDLCLPCGVLGFH